MQRRIAPHTGSHESSNTQFRQQGPGTSTTAAGCRRSSSHQTEDLALNMPSLRDFCAGLIGNKEPEAPQARTVYPAWKEQNEDEKEEQHFVDNSIVTASYTVLSFVPVFLFEQFMRFANAYFLVITILQVIPAVTITEGIPTQAGPLTFVLAFDGVLTAIEDYRRHQDDARVNNTPTKVLQKSHGAFAFVPAAWKDLRVGDIIKVASGEVFPADVMFLYAQHDDPDEATICHVQTAQLDGETNLKLKKTSGKLAQAFSSAEKCAEFSGFVEAGPPDAAFSTFDGAMDFADGQREGLYASGLLLRGTEVRNCDFVHAMVIYTGDDTKVRVKANKKAGGKYGSIDNVIDQVVLIQVGLVMLMSLIGAIGFGIFTAAETADDNLFYLRFGNTVEGSSLVGETCIKFLTFFLVTSNLVPISLYVSIRIARQTQRFFMEFDEFTVYNRKSGGRQASPDDIVLLMNSSSAPRGGGTDTEDQSQPKTMHATMTAQSSLADLEVEEEDKVRVKVRRQDLNDELGQITHVFSDKTGTLTANSFEFRKLSVNSVAYGLGTTPIGLVRRRRMGEDTSEAERMLNEHASKPRLVAHVNFMDGIEDTGADWQDHLSATQDMASTADIGDISARSAADSTGAISHIERAVSRRRKSDSSTVAPSEARSLGAFPGAESMADCLGEEMRRMLKPASGQSSSAVEAYFAWLQKNHDALEQEAGSVGDHRVGSILPNAHRDDCPLTPHQQALHYFMLNMSLDHSVEIETKRDDNGDTHGRLYSASSPDEEAFVAAAALFGYRFNRRSKTELELDIAGTTHMYRVAAMLAYDQARKMMSVLVQEVETNEWFLLAKGADSKMSSLLDTRERWTKQAQRVVAGSSEHTYTWAEDGLRTLAFAWRPLSAQYAEDWLSRFDAANASVEQRGLKGKGEKNDIDTLMAELERDLIMQGATGIEDRLQDDVGETIAVLVEAGIKVWMLTGDKQETAINIGYAVQMLSNEYRQIVLTTNSLGSDGIDDASRLISEYAEEFRQADAKHMLSTQPQALVLDDATIGRLTEEGSEQDRANLLLVAQHCSSVIACRCSPNRKRVLLLLIKEGVKDSRCLAVGDGANDVDMIVASNVGVGIVGAEGAQAANSADYAIGQFKYLQRLLLVHGRWNYSRLCLLILYLFYKNTEIVFGVFVFAIIAGWSGQRFTLETIITTYNVFLTGAPILLAAVLDQDVDQDSAMRFPFLYEYGRLGRGLTLKNFVWWMFTGLFEASVLLVLSVLATVNSAGGEPGSPFIALAGATFASAVTVTVNLRLLLVTSTHHWTFQVLVFLSVAALFVLIPFADAIDDFTFNGGASQLFATPAYWFVTVGGPFAVLTLAYTVQVASHMWWPSYRRIVHEAQILRRLWQHDLSFLPVRMTHAQYKAAKKSIPGYAKSNLAKNAVDLEQPDAKWPAGHIAVWGQPSPDKTVVVPFESTNSCQMWCATHVFCHHPPKVQDMKEPSNAWLRLAYDIREWPHTQLREERVLRRRQAMEAGDSSITEKDLAELDEQLRVARYQTLVERGQVLPGITEVPRSIQEENEGSVAVGGAASSPGGAAGSIESPSGEHKHSARGAEEYKIHASATAPQTIGMGQARRPLSGAPPPRGIRVSSMRLGSMNPAHEDGMIGPDTGAASPVMPRRQLNDSDEVGPSAVHPAPTRVQIKETRLGEAWSDDEDTATSGIEEEKLP